MPTVLFVLSFLLAAAPAAFAGPVDGANHITSTDRAARERIDVYGDPAAAERPHVLVMRNRDGTATARHVDLASCIRAARAFLSRPHYLFRDAYCTQE